MVWRLRGLPWCSSSSHPLLSEFSISASRSPYLRIHKVSIRFKSSSANFCKIYTKTTQIVCRSVFSVSEESIESVGSSEEQYERVLGFPEEQEFVEATMWQSGWRPSDSRQATIHSSPGYNSAAYTAQMWRNQQTSNNRNQQTSNNRSGRHDGGPSAYGHRPQQQQQNVWRNQSVRPTWQNGAAIQENPQIVNTQAFPPLPSRNGPQNNYVRPGPYVTHNNSRYGGYGNQHRGWNHNRRGQENNRYRQLDDSRHWLDSKERATSSGDKFVLLSYNILAANNAMEHYKELYYHIPMRFVRWGWRKVRLVQEIEFWSPDILCLQEVDRFNELQEDLKKKSYAGVYKNRTGAATDGCAIFWKQSRFALLAEESIEFKDLGLRDNVAQFCVLKSTTTCEAALNGEATSDGHCVVVANTHVLFNPKRGDIKLGQVRTLLNTAHELSIAWGGAQVVIAGDFNSTPSSPLYRFISTSELDVSSIEKRSISGQLAAREGGYQNQRPWIRNTSWRTTSETKSVQSSGVTTESNVVVHENMEIIMEEKREDLKISIDSETLENVEAQIIDTETITSETITSVEEEISEFEEDNGTAESGEMKCSKTVHFEDGCVSKIIQDSSSEDEEKQRVCTPVRTALQEEWSAEELANATGSANCTTLSHNLKLRSAYSEIQGGVRDATGEPLATTYHKKFMGTVDYIWHTEGLRPFRVLDCLPVEVLRQRGLPSQKWGSDHLALVCELGFT